MKPRGIIFDLDGTLVDSGLDFDAIKREMGLPPHGLILEAIDQMPDGQHKTRCLSILRDHELNGADRATLMPGVGVFLDELTRHGIFQAVLTRNNRESTDRVLDRLGLKFSKVLTREDVPHKPDPTGLLEICKFWQISVDDALFIGDFQFDLQAGKNAGIRTVLYAPDGLPDFAHEADFVIRDFSEAIKLIEKPA